MSITGELCTTKRANMKNNKKKNVEKASKKSRLSFYPVVHKKKKKQIKLNRKETRSFSKITSLFFSSSVSLKSQKNKYLFGLCLRLLFCFYCFHTYISTYFNSIGQGEKSIFLSFSIRMNLSHINVKIKWNRIDLNGILCG